MMFRGHGHGTHGAVTASLQVLQSSMPGSRRSLVVGAALQHRSGSLGPFMDAIASVNVLNLLDAQRFWNFLPNEPGK
jgi:hypothetical protein